MKNYNVLVVEDDLLFLVALERGIKKLGYQVLDVVDNSEDALAVLEEKTPDFILMDISIKGPLDGIELARVIRKDKPIPIVFLSAHQDKAIYEEARRIQHADYLIKPFDTSSLSRAIDRLMEG